MLKRKYLIINIAIFLSLLIIILFSRLFSLSHYFKLQANPEKKLIVVFRNDDIQNFSGSKLELKLFRIFKENNISQTYALVPFEINLLEKRELMKILKEHLKLGLAEIALHGYAHQDLGKRTEFLGRPLAEQFKKIKVGKSYLEDLFKIKIITFIPPFNSYDLNTIKACRENNIKVLSSSNFFFYKDISDIAIVNASALLFTPLSELELARKNGGNLSVFIIYYHSYMGNIYPKDDYYGQMEKLIKYIKSKDNIEVITLGEAGLKYPDYFRERYRIDGWAAKANTLLNFYRQKEMNKKLNRLSICSESNRKITCFIFISFLYVYGALFLIGFLLALFLNLIKRKLVYFISPVLLLIWIVMVKIFGSDYRIGVVDISFLVLAIGFIFNVIISYLTESYERFAPKMLTIVEGK